MDKSIKSVIIIDDEEHIRHSFVDYFDDRFWQTYEAESGELAIKMILKKPVNCAIVDIRLLGMDGNTFIRKAHKINSNMVFIICTGSPEYIIPEDLLKLKCVSGEIFRKPVLEISNIEKELLRLIKICSKL